MKAKLHARRGGAIVNLTMYDVHARKKESKMNLKCLQRTGLAFATVVLMSLFIQPSFAQKGSGSTANSASGAGGKAPSGSDQGSQNNGGSQGSPTSASSSGRIEPTMLAYESSDKIAAHIAGQIQGYRVFIYDSQSFANLQAYDAYAGTVSAFEMSFRMLEAGQFAPQSSFAAVAPAVQSIVASLGALRSTAEYTAQPVDFQTDAVIAQVSRRLPSSVIVPKVLLLSDDLKSPDLTQITNSDCSSTRKTALEQIGCVLKVRNDASVAAQMGTDTQKKAFSDLDKLFQVFFGTLIGTSANLSTKSSPTAPTGTQAPSDDSGKPTSDGQPTTSPLSAIIMGRRLKSQLMNDDKKSRILVLEATAAGGGSRIKHNFWIELFWVTPTPTFTGGAVVTYMLIDPTTSAVEKSDVLRFTVDYGKFHGKKVETPSNFQ